MRRVDCRRCRAVVVEEVPWTDGKRTLTKAYMLFLARWASLYALTQAAYNPDISQTWPIRRHTETWRTHATAVISLRALYRNWSFAPVLVWSHYFLFRVLLECPGRVSLTAAAR